MTTCRAVNDGSLGELLGYLRGGSWSWSVRDVPRFATDRGWAVVESVPGKGAVLDARWGIGTEEVQMSFTDDAVDMVMMRLTDVVADDDPSARSFLQETFAKVVCAATRHLGEPTKRALGSQPEVRWRGADATVLIENVGVAVNVTWATNRWQDYWDSLREEHA